MVGVGTGGGEQLAPVRGVVPSREEVAADVRRIVGNTRSRSEFLRLETPALDRLLALEGRSHDDGPDLLARGISAIDRDQYRQFLEQLLPLPFEEGERWPSLGPSRRGPGRGDLAARVFGLDTWDGCTRPSATLDGRSRRDWAELHLATALIRVATEAGAGPGDADRDDGAHRWRPRAATVVAALVGLVAVAATVLVITSRGAADGPDPDRAEGGGRPSASTSVPGGVLGEQCVIVGDLDPTVAARPDAAQVAGTLQDVYRRAGGEAELGCALAPAGLWEGMVVQELESTEFDPPHAIVLSDAVNGLVLTPAQWGTYKRIGSGSGNIAGDVAGAPLRIVDRPDGGTEIHTATGVVTVGESRNSPHFWIPAQFVGLWRAHPELGRPTSNPMLPGRQEFEFGIAELDLAASEPAFRLLDDPTEGLPERADRRGSIVGQSDSTSWFVDDQDRRHWIATAEVYECLAERATVHDDVPGHAIATLAPGGHAECPSES